MLLVCVSAKFRLGGRMFVYSVRCWKVRFPWLVKERMWSKKYFWNVKHTKRIGVSFRDEPKTILLLSFSSDPLLPTGERLNEIKNKLKTLQHIFDWNSITFMFFFHAHRKLNSHDYTITYPYLKFNYSDIIM